MTIALSQLFKSSTTQSFRALVNMLEKAKAHAAEAGAEEGAYLENRLYPDMHPMKWQVQMIAEFAVRGAARLQGVAADDLPDTPYDADSFDALIARVKQCDEIVKEADDAVLDKAHDMKITIPVGPDDVMEFDGKTYATMFFLPNLHFHVTTAYALLRSQGVKIGKRDYMGA